MLYTIVDLSDVFYDEKNFKLSCREMGNLHIEGVDIDGVFKPRRIISTNPCDYLKYSNIIN